MAHFPFTMQLGAVLRRVRKSEKLSMEKLGLMVGTSRRHISNIEKGEVNTSIEMLYRLAEGLGVSLAGIIQEALDGVAGAGAAGPAGRGAGMDGRRDLGGRGATRPPGAGRGCGVGLDARGSARAARTGGSDMDAGMRARREAAGRQEAQRRRLP